MIGNRLLTVAIWLMWQDWRSLEWASDELKKDREIVLKAVSQRRSLAWQWASGPSHKAV